MDLDIKEDVNIEESPDKDLKFDGDNFSDDESWDKVDNDIWDKGAEPIEKYEGLLKELTNFHPYFKELAIDWLGLTWDAESEKYINDPDLEKRINKKGINYILSFSRTYIRNNNIITNLEEQDYKAIMTDVVDVVFDNLYTRSENFEIKDEGDLKTLAIQVIDGIALILMGAGDGKYTEFLRDSNKEVTTSRIDNNQGNNNQNDNKNVMSNIFGGVFK